MLKEIYAQKNMSVCKYLLHDKKLHTTCKALFFEKHTHNIKNK